MDNLEYGNFTKDFFDPFSHFFFYGHSQIFLDFSFFFWTFSSYWRNFLFHIFCWMIYFIDIFFHLMLKLEIGWPCASLKKLFSWLHTTSNFIHYFIFQRSFNLDQEGWIFINSWNLESSHHWDYSSHHCGEIIHVDSFFHPWRFFKFTNGFLLDFDWLIWNHYVLKLIILELNGGIFGVF